VPLGSDTMAALRMTIIGVLILSVSPVSAGRIDKGKEKSLRRIGKNERSIYFMLTIKNLGKAFWQPKGPG